jgi:hypothetical protein
VEAHNRQGTGLHVIKLFSLCRTWPAYRSIVPYDSIRFDEPSRLTPIKQEPAMSGVTPIRDPKTDSLLTPQNAVLALIDYQPEQYAGVASVRHDELLAHVTKLGRVATSFELPVVRKCQSNTDSPQVSQKSLGINKNTCSTKFKPEDASATPSHMNCQ